MENTNVEAAQPLNTSESDMTAQEPQRQDPEQQQQQQTRTEEVPYIHQQHL